MTMATLPKLLPSIPEDIEDPKVKKALVGFRDFLDDLIKKIEKGRPKALYIDENNTVSIGGRLQVTGDAMPSGGTGVELGHAGTNGLIVSYDRTNAEYKNMRYNALSHEFEVSGVKKASIDSSGIFNITTKTPASAGADGNAGDICWDSDYIYVCVDTNTWERAALSSW